MSRAWKTALVLAVVLLFAFSLSLAWGAPQNGLAIGDIIKNIAVNLTK